MHGEGDVQQVAAPTDAAVRVCKTGNSSLAFQTLLALLEISDQHHSDAQRERGWRVTDESDFK